MVPTKRERDIERERDRARDGERDILYTERERDECGLMREERGSVRVYTHTTFSTDYD